MKEHEKPKQVLSLAKAVQRGRFLIETRCNPQNSMWQATLGKSETEHAAAVEAIALLIQYAERDLK